MTPRFHVLGPVSSLALGLVVAFVISAPLPLASASHAPFSPGASPAIVGTPPNPSALLYSPGDHDLYVANEGNDTVTVMDGRTNAVLATIPVGTGPDGLAYDPATNTVLVSNGGSDNLTVIDSRWSVTGTIPVGNTPRGIVYDPANSKFYVANTGSGNVSIVDPTSATPSKSIAVGLDPWAVAYDPSDRDVFVTNSASGNVSVISSRSDTVIATVATGTNATGGPAFAPAGVAFDPATRQVIVTNPGLQNVVAIDSASLGVVARTNVSGSPWAVAFDPIGSVTIVTQYANGTMVLLNGSLSPVGNSYAVGGQPVAVAQNPSNHKVAVASYVSATPIVLHLFGIPVDTLGGPSQTSIEYPGIPGYDPLSHEWFVPNDPGFDLHPAGPNGSIAIVTGGASGSIVSTVTTYGISPQQVVFDSYSDDLYVANLESGTVSLLDANFGYFLANISTPLTEGFAILDDPANHDLYLSDPGGTSLAVISAKTNTVVGSIGVGDAPAGLAYSPATGDIYCVNYLDNNVSVISGSTNSVVANIDVGYEPLYAAYDPTNHDVYVVNSDNLTVIDSTNTVVDWVSVPGLPLLWHIAYDAANGDMVVAGIQVASLYWVSSTDQLVATTPTASEPTGLGYDPVNKEVIVCNYAEDSVSFLYA